LATVGDDRFTSGVADDVPPLSSTTMRIGRPFPHRPDSRGQKALRRLPDLQVQIRALQDEIELWIKSQ